MATAADGQALLDAILDHPDDLDRRLVYADWLDDSGDADRAEFVRVQVALAPGQFDRALLRREMELLAQNEYTWAGTTALGKGDRRWLGGFVEYVEADASDWLDFREALCAAHPVRKVALRRLRLVNVRWGSAGRRLSFRPDDALASALRVASAPEVHAFLTAAGAGKSGEATPSEVLGLLQNAIPALAFACRRGRLSLPEGGVEVEVRL